MRVLSILALAGAMFVTVAAQDVPSTVHPLHRPFDRLLDTYVRDGFVYYNALRIERAPLDRYVAALNGPAATALAQGSPDERKAFWINAYNALVLRTVIDHFPIRGRSRDYPASSIRQIPGAFESPSHRIAGRAVSLDMIEKDILGPLGDPRVFLALGRGAYGGGRLRSEAFDGPTLEQTLLQVEQEAALRDEIANVDAIGNTLSVTPIFSWREQAFVTALAAKAAPLFEQRSPLERAVLGLILPHLPPSEQEFLRRNTFTMQFHPFDWRLNDLSARQ